jgi:hypothetical protein
MAIVIEETVVRTFNLGKSRQIKKPMRIHQLLREFLTISFRYNTAVQVL